MSRAATARRALEDAKGVLILSGDGGKRLAITLFESEEGLRRGDEALNEMTPVGMGVQHRGVLRRRGHGHAVMFTRRRLQA